MQPLVASRSRCGLQLGWLINPQDKQVEIYRPNRAIEVLQQPETLSGEDVLPGFLLRLQKIWIAYSNNERDIQK
ncbi:hypothetical protein C7B70_25595 [Chlorogloea sp. CCALA 695]|nr:hypothetical protein C7B70_25595 [Chlorogloea sp. CCALA 695]